MSTKNLEGATEKKVSKKELLRRQNKKEKMQKILSYIVVGVLIAALLATVVMFVASIPTPLDQIVSVKSDDYKIDNAMVAYYFHTNVNSFINDNYDYLSFYGLDTSKSLKQQSYIGDESKTWYDFFIEQTKSTVEELILFAEAAKDAGLELDVEDQANIETNIAYIKAYASAYGYTTDSYISAQYGEGVDEAAIRRCLKLSHLASKYYQQEMDKLSYTDEDYNTYLEENPSKFLKIDYYAYAFEADVEKDADEETVAAAVAEAKKKADALAAVTTVEDFRKAVYDILYAEHMAEKSEDDEEESKEDEVVKTDEEIVWEEVDKLLREGIGYSDSSDIGKWLFDSARKANDTYVDAGDDYATAYIVVKPAYKEDYKSVNVRHILLTKEEYETEEATLEKANEVLNTFLAGDKTVEKFAELVKEFSEDTGSSENEGLYENVLKGTMVTEFNDWCFDEARKVGDTGIVETEYGQHIMYFDGFGEPAWKVSALELLKQQDYEAMKEALAEKYTIKFNDKKFEKLGVN